MKILSCFIVLAFALQGATPGLIVCFDHTGHVQVETVGGGCCCDGGISGERSGGADGERPEALNPASACGPCTDTPIFSAPIVKPVRDDDRTDVAFSNDCRTIPPPSRGPDPAAAAAGNYNSRAYADAALIPVKTTALLM